jgi:uncharacterized protein YlxW (UPF0749 family)
MSLLVDLLGNAHDPSYAAVARRRADVERRARPESRARRGTRWGLLALLGLATGTAVAGVRATSDDGARARASLVAEVRDRSATAQDLAGQVADVRADVAARQQAALSQGAAGRQLGEARAAAELAAAVVPVAGPGIVVTLGDEQDRGTAGGGARPRRGTSGLVTDRDLQGLVNGLWSVGAEAVSVNGLRLTARSAIRFAGQAVLVDFRPISPPYVVQAIGDPSRLLPDFQDSVAGRRLLTWTRINDLPYTVTSGPDLALPAGSVLDPVVATPSASPS